MKLQTVIHAVHLTVNDSMELSTILGVIELYIYVNKKQFLIILQRTIIVVVVVVVEPGQPQSKGVSL